MKVKVKIENLEQTLEAEVGEDLRRVLLDNDVELYAGLAKHTNCHGKGLCTTCQIEVVEGPGLSDQGPMERLRIGKKRRLACQTRIYQDVVIRTLHQPKPMEY